MAAPTNHVGKNHRDRGGGTNPHGGAYRGSPIPRHAADVAAKRVFRAADRRTEKQRRRDILEAKRLEREQEREQERRKEIEYAAALHKREVRWARIDEWHRFLDEGHAALQFGNAPAKLRPFFEHHYRARRPIAFARGHFARPALAGATFEYLSSRWGTTTVEVQDDRVDPTAYEINGSAHKKPCSFNEFLRALKHGKPNTCYMTANNAGANGELLRDLAPYLSPLPDLLTGSPEQGFLWIGRGSFTPVHHDLTNNLLFQLVGTKKVTLYPPHMHRMLRNITHVYAGYDTLTPNQARMMEIDFEEVILRPGEALFIPVGWWHMVEALHNEPAVYSDQPSLWTQWSNSSFAPTLPEIVEPEFDAGPEGLNITYTSTMFAWDNHSWHGAYPG